MNDKNEIEKLDTNSNTDSAKLTMSAKVLKEAKEWGNSLAFALVVAGILFVVARPSVVKGSSMEPSFHENEIVLMEKISPFFSKIKRGDIIVARSKIPYENDNNKFKDIIKRVIAIPGDKLLIRNGTVTVNGESLEEDYILESYTPGEFDGELAENMYFLMGDNRSNSNDSRNQNVGSIEKKNIVGKVYFRLWPLNKIKGF